MQRNAKWVAARAAGAIGVGIAVIDGLERVQVITERVPTTYAPFIYVLCFGAALLLIDSARKEEIAQLRLDRAAVRARYRSGAADYPIVLTNIGSVEAHGVQAAPICYDRYPWKVTFDEIGSVPPTRVPESPRVSIGPHFITTACTPCSGQKPRNFEEFLLGLATHLQHVIRGKSEVAKSFSESTYEIRAAAGAAHTIHVRLAINFSDRHGSVMSLHRLECLLVGQQLQSVNCVYEAAPVDETSTVYPAPASPMHG